MDALLEIKNIETYYDLIYALRGVSLAVEEGTITTILGTNGAGKSTILKTVMGLIDDQPDKGTITFDDRRIDGRDTEEIVRRGISFVPEGREVFEELTVHENLLMGAYTRRDREQIASDFERVYDYFPVLQERSRQWAGTLSGGEQQMLAVARALMTRPKVLLLDEPSLGLAPLIVQKIFDIIATVNEEEGTTILLVEQNANMALQAAQRGYVLETGTIKMEDEAGALLHNPEIRKAYLGE